ncbi:hypothetical protein D4R78_07010 [bacterium]|nr:MAG: hypothetical protein D4R78_07010 [bacterium]
MSQSRISLKQGGDFHGHLGPYLVLGILAGEAALKKLNADKYFGLDVKVRGAAKKPKSCLIDGLQLSTGATYGKGNIRKLNGAAIKIIFSNRKNNKKIVLELKNNIIKKLGQAKSHRDSEILARELYRTGPLRIFNLTPKT